MLNAARLGVTHPSGYPVYTWLGWLAIQAIPGGDPAWRMNLLSALYGAAAVGVLQAVACALGLPALIAAGSALLFGLSRTFWSQALIAEIYTADVLALATVLWLLLRWAAAVRAAGDGAAAGPRARLLAFALAWGVSLGTHLSNLGFAPAFAVFALLADPGLLRRLRQLALAAAVFALGVAQYAWLPLRGGRFDLYPNPQPDTLQGFLAYTVGAFRGLRFAFPLSALPQRMELVMRLVVENLGVAGALLGLAGTWVALARGPGRFWLVAGVAAVNVGVFSQFAVPDPEVFFLPAYLAWALFAGFAADAGWRALAARVAPDAGPARTALAAALAVVAAAWLLRLAAANFTVNDRTGDTAVPDFDRNALAMLPANAALATPRGAFGAGMAYWREVVGLRPDVLLVSQGADVPRSPERPYYTAMGLAGGRPTPTARMGQRADLFPEDAWYVPVLLGTRIGQVLARVDARPPSLLATEPPAVAATAARVVGPVTFHGAEVALRPGAPSPRVRLRSWWRLAVPPAAVFSTRVGDVVLESHEPGLGNLARWAAEVGWPADGLLHEDVDVALPSTLAPGPHAVAVGVTTFSDTGFATEWLDAGTVALR